MASKDLIGNFLEKIALYTSAAPRKTLFVLLLITALAGWVASGIRLDPSILNLIPKNRPAVQEYVHHEEDFSHTEYMISVIETPKKIPLSRYRRFIKEFQSEVSQIPQVRAGRLTLDDQVVRNFKNYLTQHGMMLLSPENLLELNQGLSPPKMEMQLKSPKLYRQQYGREIFDPFEMLSLSRELAPLTNIAVLDKSNEFFVANDSRTVFFLVGIDSPWLWNETKEIVDQAKEIEKRAWDEVMPKGQGMNTQQIIPPPKITWLGKAMDILRVRDAILDSFQKTILWTALLTVLTFLFFFRNIRALFLAYIPLFMGLVWSFAAARLMVGHLNILSVTCGAVLIGLGIDFPAYLLSQYFQQRLKGSQTQEALKLSWRKTGRFVLFGCLTTMVTFFLLIFSHLPAWRDIALITTIGLFLTLLAIFLALPPLIVLTERAGSPRKTWQYPSWLIHWPLQRPRGTLLIVVLCFGVLIFFNSRLHFTTPLQEAYYLLKQPGDMAFLDYEHYSSLFGSSLVPMRLIIQGNNWEEALEKNEKLFSLLKKYQDQNQISYIDSLYYLLPSQKRQKMVASLLDTLENLKPENFSSKYEKMRNEVLLKKRRDLVTRQESIIYGKKLKESLEGRKPVLPQDLEEAGLGKILNHYLAQKPHQYLLSTYVLLPPGDYLSLKKGLLDQLKKEEMFAQGEVVYSSEEMVFNELNHLMIEDIAWLGPLALILTFLLLWWGLHSWKMAALSFVPMALGGAAAFGAFALMGRPFSIFNLLIVPIYIGMATDDALHLGEEMLSPGEGDPIGRSLGKWGGIIILTSLTNMAAFGSNLFTHFEFLRRIGVWITLALGCELIASLFFLPALYKLLFFKGGTKGSKVRLAHLKRSLSTRLNFRGG